MSGEPMDIQRNDDRQHIRLGTVERWVVIAGVALLTAALGFIFHTITGNSRDQNQAIAQQGMALGEIKTQIAVTNNQLVMLTQQLSDMTSLASTVAEMKVQVSRNRADIHDLQQQPKDH